MSVERFRRLYGAGPLHLTALVASFALAGAAVVGWFERPDELGAVFVWFLAAIVGHDLILLPLYSLLDRIAFGRRGSATRRAAAEGGLDPERGGGAQRVRGGAAYVRVPALLSGLLLLVFFPVIFGLGSGTFRVASGLGQDGYLARWLAATGALFALSGLAYALALARGRGRGGPPAGGGSGGA